MRGKEIPLVPHGLWRRFVFAERALHEAVLRQRAWWTAEGAEREHPPGPFIDLDKSGAFPAHDPTRMSDASLFLRTAPFAECTDHKAARHAPSGRFPTKGGQEHPMFVFAGQPV